MVQLRAEFADAGCRAAQAAPTGLFAFPNSRATSDMEDRAPGQNWLMIKGKNRDGLSVAGVAGMQADDDVHSAIAASANLPSTKSMGRSAFAGDLLGGRSSAARRLHRHHPATAQPARNKDRNE